MCAIPGALVGRNSPNHPALPQESNSPSHAGKGVSHPSQVHWKDAICAFVRLPTDGQVEVRAIESVLRSIDTLWVKACGVFAHVASRGQVSLPPRIYEHVLGRIYSGIPAGRRKFQATKNDLRGRDQTLLGLWSLLKQSRQGVLGCPPSRIPGSALKHVLTCLAAWKTSLRLFADDVKLVQLEAAHLFPVIRCIEDARLAGCPLGMKQMKELQRLIVERSKEDPKLLSGENGGVLIERLIRNCAIISLKESLSCIAYFLPGPAAQPPLYTPTAPTLFFCWLITYLRQKRELSAVCMRRLKELYHDPVWRWISVIDLNFAFRVLMNDRKAVWATNRDIPGSPDGGKARTPNDVTPGFYGEVLSLAQYCMEGASPPDSAECHVPDDRKFSSLHFHCAIFFASLDAPHTEAWKVSLAAFSKVRVPREELNQYTRHGRPHAAAFPLSSYIENSCRLITAASRGGSLFPMHAQIGLFNELKARLPVAALFASGSIARNLAKRDLWESAIKYFKSFMDRPASFATLNFEASSPVVACHVIQACAKNGRWMEAVHLHNEALRFIDDATQGKAASSQPTYATGASSMIGRALLSSFTLFVGVRDLEVSLSENSPIPFVRDCVTKLLCEMPHAASKVSELYLEKLEKSFASTHRYSVNANDCHRIAPPSAPSLDGQSKRFLSWTIH